MSTYIKIENGTYRNQPVNGMVFPLVKDFTKTAKSSFVTVDGSKQFGRETMRVTVTDINDIAISSISEYENQAVAADPIAEAVQTVLAPKVEKTDDEIKQILTERFNVLDLMTRATIAGDVRGLIVTGPPGVGKSYGVEQELEKAGLFDTVAGNRPRYHICKGASSALGLYVNLYKSSEKGNVIVFDDCDTVLQDEVCLNLLKGALDSGKKRRLSWNSSESKYLDKEGIPNDFLFNGAVIFITNVKFEHVRSKKMQDHLEALQSRCHYLDLTMDTMREKLIRIEQVAETGELFSGYDFSKNDEAEVLEFMTENKDKFREMSIRMALKISDLKKIDKDNWKQLVRTTCMYNHLV